MDAQQLGFFDKKRTGDLISWFAKKLKPQGLSTATANRILPDLARTTAANMSPEAIGYVLKNKKIPSTISSNETLRQFYKDQVFPAMQNQIAPINILDPEYKQRLSQGTIAGINPTSGTSILNGRQIAIPENTIKLNPSGSINKASLKDITPQLISNPLLNKEPLTPAVQDIANEMTDAASTLSQKTLDAIDAANPSSAIDIANGTSLKDLFKLTKNATKAHPLKALGYIGGGAANLGGLFDNDKFGGQLGAGALGAFAGSALGNPVMGALMGGALGAQFDKLRAQREASAQQAQQRMR